MLSGMPSSLHEALIEIFRCRPVFAADLLANALGLDLPDYQLARLESGELNNLTPTEHRADAVVVLTTANRPVLAIVVEAQLHPDRHKRWSWPVYLATLRARLRCPTVLLVICVKASVAKWCAQPIDLGHPGWVLYPLVAGPDRVPPIADADQAKREPELAVLSAVAHGNHPDHEKIMHALLTALASVDPERAALYNDIVFAALPSAARRSLEELMASRTYEYQSEFVRKFIFQGRAEGQAQEEARAIVEVLDARGFDVPDDVRARIAECSDLDRLRLWLRRAVTINAVADLFD
jgi:hypothetical protein